MNANVDFSQNLTRGSHCFKRPKSALGMYAAVKFLYNSFTIKSYKYIKKILSFADGNIRCLGKSTP